MTVLSPSKETKKEIINYIKSKSKARIKTLEGKEVGVLNILSEQEARQFMSEKVKDILDSYDSKGTWLYKEADQEKIVQEALPTIKEKIEFDREVWTLGNTIYFKEKYSSKEEIIRKQLGESVESKLAKGCIIRAEYPAKPEKMRLNEWGQIVAKYPRYDVQKPTKSGGFGEFNDAYSVSDSKTHETVNLWEYGVDYDVG